jgi:hypothetical protein
LVTDTLGLLIAVLITAGSMQDRDAALPAMNLAMAKAPSIQMLYVDGGYAGRSAQELRDRHQIQVEVVRHPANRKIGRWQQGQLPPGLDPESRPQGLPGPRLVGVTTRSIFKVGC